MARPFCLTNQKRLRTDGLEPIGSGRKPPASVTNRARTNVFGCLWIGDCRIELESAPTRPLPVDRPTYLRDLMPPSLRPTLTDRSGSVDGGANGALAATGATHHLKLSGEEQGGEAQPPVDMH